MIALDTNVLLRHVLQDDAEQSPRASKLIAEHDNILITDVVLTEAIWTLRGKRYQASRDVIIKFVSDLLSERAFQLENPHAVWGALNDYQEERPRYNESGKKQKLPDFADALIVHKAKQIAKKDKEPLNGVYSFDKGVLLLAGTQRV